MTPQLTSLFFIFKVNCTAIFENKLIDSTYVGTPPNWTDIPVSVQHQFTHGGRVRKLDWYLNDADIGGDMTINQVYSKKYIDDMGKISMIL